MIHLPLNWQEHYRAKTGGDKATMQDRTFWTPVRFPAAVGFGEVEARVKRQFSHGVPACRRGHSHFWQHLSANGGDGPNARVYRCCPHCDTIQETGRGTWYTDAWDERRQVAAIQREIASMAVQP